MSVGVGGGVCIVCLWLLFMNAILCGCKTCNIVDAPDEWLKKLFGYKAIILFEALLGDKFVVGDFLVNLIVYKCCWRGLGWVHIV